MFAAAVVVAVGTALLLLLLLLLLHGCKAKNLVERKHDKGTHV
jgi:hypothetical protein